MSAICLRLSTVCLALFVLALPTLAQADPPTHELPIPAIRLERAWPAVRTNRPIQIIARPDRDDVLYVIEQRGRVRTVNGEDTSSSESELVLDITDRVNARSNEEGLLSVAFHPDFEKNNEVYFYYSAKTPRRSVLSRMKMDDERKTFDPDSEEVLLEIPQPYWNHNGGMILFGPDGMLYLAIGDGGAANDPHNNGQNTQTLLASIIRIDVSKDAGNAERPYGIPSDNPFVDDASARSELWAIGLRNVWRMCFDPKTETILVGDVGQNKFEEISEVERGGNYGWNIREGAHPFRRARDGDPASNTLKDPIAEYPRKQGISVTGGYVYRGKEFPTLTGTYLYADYAYGNVWGIRRTENGWTTPKVVLKKRGSLMSSFGEANDGELFMTTFEGDEGGPGALWKVTAK